MRRAKHRVLAVIFSAAGLIAFAGRDARGGAPVFQPRVSRSLGTSALWTAAGDFNGDGRLDVTVGSGGGAKLTTFLTQPDGTFPLTGSVTTTSGVPTRVRAADLNNDGRSDLLLITNNGMEVRYSLGNGTFSAATALGPSGSQIWGNTAIADMNGDGRPDLLATSRTSTQNQGGFYLAYGTSTGGFSSPLPGVATASNASGIGVADLNRDGHPDVIVGDEISGLKVAYGTNTGTFTVKSFSNSDRAYDIATGDFNGDGIPDVAFPAWNSKSVGVMLTQPNGDLGPVHFYSAVGSPDSIAVGDFNRDGILDLVESSQNGSDVGVVLGNGDGSFANLTTLSASADGSSTVTVGDFDGNGYDDIAVAAASGTNLDIFYNALPEPGSVSVLGFGMLLCTRRRRGRRRIPR